MSSIHQGVFMTPSWMKWLRLDGMHFTHYTKVNDDMEFHYYKKTKNPNHQKLKQLGFTSRYPLWLNG
jgi:hypothetical protein